MEKYAQIGGLCVALDGIVFVVSSWDNCVKVLSPKFKIIAQIGVDILTAPKDVKVSLFCITVPWICWYVFIC